MSEYSKHPLMRYACDSCHGSGKWYDTHVHEDYAPLENTCPGCKGTGLDREKVKNALNIQATDKEIEQLQKAWQIINEANDRQFQEIEKQDAELARLREALDMPDGYVLLPVKPTYELVVAMAVKKWPDIWEKGKKLQMELGCGVVPPNAECEEAAGTYMQLIEALKSNDS